MRDSTEALWPLLPFSSGLTNPTKNPRIKPHMKSRSILMIVVVDDVFVAAVMALLFAKRDQ
jgi:hypothetical protein